MTDDAPEPRDTPRPDEAREPRDTPRPGPGPDDPPPFVARYGLVRPPQGRYLAGVCAALGRATNTDPVLWRVLLAVLTCFGGVGALVYLVLWLVTPEEEDTASPVEALFGRGRSSTSPVLVVLIGVLAAIFVSLLVSHPFYLVLLAGAVVLALALIHNRQQSGAPQAPPQPPAEPPRPGGTVPPRDSVPPVPVPGPAPTGGAVPSPGYRPAFAPHGPFASAPPPLFPPPPPAPRERSVLGPITFFATLIVLGTVTAADLTAFDVPAAGYVAAALATVGAGLLAGAWVGRARPLIALGLVLALALPMAVAADALDPGPRHAVGASTTWTPASHAELEDRYEVTFGEGVLDLRQVDFAGQDTGLTVRVTFGDMQIILPADVDVEATWEVRLAEASLFGDHVEGIRGGQDVIDAGTDGTGGGTLHLDIEATFANLEVYR